MALDELMVADGQTIYYDDDFRQVLEDHLTILRASPTSTIVDIAPNYAYRYETDLYGLLQQYNIPRELHWLVMRLNGYLSPLQYRADRLEILVPNTTQLNQLRTSHMTTRRLTTG